MEVELAEILGLLCAEGCHVVSYSSYTGLDKGKTRFYKNKKSERIEFSSKDMKLLVRFKFLIKRAFGYKVNITKDNKINICKRAIIKSLLNHTPLGNEKWRVPGFIINSSKNIKLAFLRGYFDGDGTASNRMRFFSINYKGIKQICKLLTDLQVKHTLQGPVLKKGKKPSYVIQISEKEKEKFLKDLKPCSKRPGSFAGVNIES